MEKNVTVIDEREVLGKEFRMYGTFDEPLFLAKDVAEWIDYAKTSKGTRNVSMMLKSVDEDEKVIKIVDTLGGAQETWFLTEDGLYEVLMQSRKPIAKSFKKKVKEILKEIRKTGSYSVDSSPTNILKLIVAQFEQHNARMDAIEQNFDEAVKACADMYDQVDAMQNKLDKTILADRPLGSKTLIEVAEYLGLYSEDKNPHAQMAGAIARACGIKTTITRAQDNQYSTTMVQVVGGVQQFVLYIKPSGWRRMREWWEDNKEKTRKVLTYKRHTVDKKTGEIHCKGDFRDCFFEIDSKRWKTDPGRDMYYGVPF